MKLLKLEARKYYIKSFKRKQEGEDGVHGIMIVLAEIENEEL